ncbi:hypothetical protein HWB51_gp042 [Mycobacterium phage Cuke]|uniref:Uncharacterized protein n=1 Tax=Mycobacterium phage Cuke TaxID=2079417 RepID=A0A2L1IWS5_9CAUD|nr:hypothetical protein HWB51_gp042 [Mycobacterium phage Cuke]AVD99660.1 hypothetical protein SEA_CUKE_42 [Mycobacterium phage Cuke]
MAEYSFRIESVDTEVAFDCEADRAEREGFTNVAKRQRDNALHVRNAVHHMQKICPEGYRVETKIVVSHVPNVIPGLRDDIRNGTNPWSKVNHDAIIRGE